MTDQLESPLPGRVDLQCLYGHRFDTQAYKLGFNRAILRAIEEHKRHGFSKAYEFAMDGEIKVNDFDSEDFAEQFHHYPLNEEKAWDSYDQGVSVGIQHYFENAADPKWEANGFFCV